MNTSISAVQHIRPLRGGAQSHLLNASDGNCYVTKFQNNPQHIRVLANEMLATRMLGEPHDHKPIPILNARYRYYDYEFGKCCKAR